MRRSILLGELELLDPLAGAFDIGERSTDPAPRGEHSIGLKFLEVFKNARIGDLDCRRCERLGRIFEFAKHPFEIRTHTGESQGRRALTWRMVVSFPRSRARGTPARRSAA